MNILVHILYIYCCPKWTNQFTLPSSMYGSTGALYPHQLLHFTDEKQRPGILWRSNGWDSALSLPRVGVPSLAWRSVTERRSWKAHFPICRLWAWGCGACRGSPVSRLIQEFLKLSNTSLHSISYLSKKNSENHLRLRSYARLCS